MTQTLNILNIEDSQADFLLVERHLRQQGMDVCCCRVDTPEALEQALDSGGWDLVLSDYSVPRLNFHDSFARIQSRLPDLPVILVSGSVGEEQAVELLKLGVQDFVLKDNLTRLVPTIERSLTEASEHKAKLATEHALHKSEVHFRSIFNKSPVAIGIGKSDSGRLVDVNDAWLILFGYGREEVIGRTMTELNLYASCEERFEIVRLISESGQVVNREVKFRRKSGEHLVVLYSAELVDLGRESFLQEMMTDVTERRNLEEQLRQSQKMEAVGQLAGGVAHDFNNIMQVIMGNAQLQLMFNHNHDLDHKYLNEIFKAVERGASLTRSLLVFCHKQPLELNIFNLNDLIRESHKLALRLVTEEITINLELGDRALNIKGDAGLVQHLVFNLVTNARDAISRQGNITISTDEVAVDGDFIAPHGVTLAEGRYALLVIKDTGCGISDEIRDRIFEPFFTTKEAGKGTGLGLAMIYGTIRQMEGLIAVESQPGVGTSFKIYIPVASESEAVPATSVTNKRAYGNGELLLVVEDREEVRDSLTKVLEIFDYRVICAANGEDAIRLARENSSEIKLAIMDMILPGMNGTETAGEICQIIPELPVLFLSGYSDETLESKGIVGCHLCKPVHPVQLLKHIRRLLDESRHVGRNSG